MTTMKKTTVGDILWKLAEANGAILRWQVPDGQHDDWQQAQRQGDIGIDDESDLYYHPDATRRVTPSGQVFYTMPAGAPKRDEPVAYKQLRARGFEVEGTGGGCTCWRLDIPGKGYCMITTNDGPDHEFTKDDLVAVGFYNEDGDEWVTFYDAKVNTSED